MLRLLDRSRDPTRAPAVTAGVEGAAAAACECGQGCEREALEPSRWEGSLHLVLELPREKSEVQRLRDAANHRSPLLGERHGGRASR
jgi:hypothetical protein